jgi:hypothetical protein
MSQEGHTRELVEVVTKLVTLQAITGNALQPCELQPVDFAMNFRPAWRDSNSQCPPSRVWVPAYSARMSHRWEVRTKCWTT